VPARIRACNPLVSQRGRCDLRALVECALDTCCRKGELLSRQWSQVDFDRNEIFLPAEKTKSGELRDDGSGDRWIPMTQRVRSRLDMRRLDSEGEKLESRMSEHAVKDILGHANIKTTSTYLATTRQRLREQMKRAEAVRRAAEKDAHGDAHGAKEEPAALPSVEISLKQLKAVDRAVRREIDIQRIADMNRFHLSTLFLETQVRDVCRGSYVNCMAHPPD
jgi:hypothetical protein